MRKIKTIFDRDWDGDKTVIDKYVEGAYMAISQGVATEKLDGMNVRITVRNHTCVRLEKRRNPDKIQKHKGIEEPWYTEAFENEPADKYLFEALKGTDLTEVPDGEWNGEALGPNIQGNPLNLEGHRIYLFSIPKFVTPWWDVPIDYKGLKEWLPKQKSKYGNNCGIEGIVWHCKNGEMFKIKTKDFIKDNRK